MWKKWHLFGLALGSVAMVLCGCGGGDDNGEPPPPAGHNPQAIVVNGTSNNISSVDLEDGSVTSNLGAIAIGPNANRVKIRGDKAYVVNSGNFSGSTDASVKVIDLNTSTVLNTIPFPDNQNPMDIAFVSDTKAYVTCLYGNNVTVIDPTKQGAAAIIKPIPLPVFDSDNGPVNAGPGGIIKSGSYAYTANSGLYLIDSKAYFVPPSVSVIDTATDTIVDADSNSANGIDTPIYLASGINPQDLDVDSEGNIWVMCTGDYGATQGVLEVVDPASRTVTASIPVGGNPWNITIGANFALIGIINSSQDSLNIYVVKTDTKTALNDSENPFVLDDAPGYWSAGKIAVTGGSFAYVPAGIYGGEAKLCELVLLGNTLQLARTFNLGPTANLPAAVGLRE